MVRAGGRLEEGLRELEKVLLDYFGAISSLSMGHLSVNIKIPEKPEALVLYEQCKKMDTPLVEGGLLDQPYIWLQEVAIIIAQEEIFERIRQVNAQNQ